MTGPSYHSRTHNLFGTDPLWVGLIQSTDDTVLIDTTAGYWDLSATPTGGTGIQFDTDPQLGNWLLIQTDGATPGNWGSFAKKYGVVFDLAPTSGNRGMLIKASQTGTSVMHAVDVDVNVTTGSGIGVGMNLVSGAASQIIGIDAGITATSTSFASGYRLFIDGTNITTMTGIYSQTDNTGTGTNQAISTQAIATSSGSATGGAFSGASSGSGDSIGVAANASNNISSGDTYGLDVVSTTRNGSGNAYGARIDVHDAASTVAGTRVTPIVAYINDKKVFELDKSGNIHLLTTASIIADLT